MDRRNLARFPSIASFLVMGVLLAACSGTPAAPAPSQTPAGEVESTEEHTEAEEHMEGEHDAEGEHGAMEGEMEHAHAEVPEAYEGLTNPFAGDESAIAAGAEVFKTNCATCHGDTGAGDGPASAALDPKPADISDRTMTETLTDGYLFWRISEGGMMPPFNSAMPAWGQMLSEEQIWQVVAYVRTLGQ